MVKDKIDSNVKTFLGLCSTKFVNFEERDDEGSCIECFVTVGLGKILGYFVVC